MSAMTIRFWGVRGSIASPGAHTARTGGNTSCVEVTCGETRLVLDAGTGLRALGNQLLAAKQPVEATLLLSHLHWDHIQGLPFFTPLYLPSTRLEVVGPRGALGVEGALRQQMSHPVFPVQLQELSSELRYREVASGQSFAVGDVQIRCAKLNHPGGVFGYRIEHAGRSVVYATDTEHYDCLDPALLGLARGADVLIYDSQYTDAEYRGDAGPPRVGWGHSTWQVGVRLAQAAGVGRYVLFHHDPSRTDEEVDAMEAAARAQFGNAVAAREGQAIELSPEASTQAA